MITNRETLDILKTICEQPEATLSNLIATTGYSKTAVSIALTTLLEQQYIDKNLNITQHTRLLIDTCKPKNAIILAAGYGIRMAPINTEIPKGLIKICGEPIIERLIKHLHEAGIKEIYLVVGHMKEKYEYLTDKYNVKLIVNTAYSTRNNLHSLLKALPYIGNSYILPCDIWSAHNIFNTTEFYSWYMVSDLIDDSSPVRINCKHELELVKNGKGGNAMVGVAYITRADADTLIQRVHQLCMDNKYNTAYWEQALYIRGKIPLAARMVSSKWIKEVNTYEQLREIDDQSDHLRTESIAVIAQTLGITTQEITDINVLKKGMTNRSFSFCCKDKKYIMRIPGEGTDALINRKEEAAVYKLIAPHQLSDKVIYMDPENGYKITEFLNNARQCQPTDMADVDRCMQKLRAFHALNLKVEHTFDLFERIDFYERLRQGQPSYFSDYAQTKQHILCLNDFIQTHFDGHKTLTHIDAIPDNFLFVPQKGKKEELRIIDWEYAAMQDPHVDIAMFAIYASYDRTGIDRLIDSYFMGQCTKETRYKIYAYVAICGLLWSNWCEYKRGLGIEFGEYSIQQYRYAKEYYRIVEAYIHEQTSPTKHE